MSWFRLWKSLKTKTSNTPIVSVEIPIGSKWRLNGKANDPFPPRKLPPVRILDVKDGWVRYYIGASFPDEREEISIFLKLYKRVE